MMEFHQPQWLKMCLNPHPLIRMGLIKCLHNGGEVAFHSSTQRFQATCGNPEHGTGCRLTRTAKAGTRFANPGQGRPLGLMLAWLEQNQQDLRVSHRVDIDFSHARRKALRQLLKQDVLGRVLLGKERETLDGEDSEPEYIS